MRSEYFARFGAEDHNILHVGDKTYAMGRFRETPDDTYYMLFEHRAGQEGVSYYMFEHPVETMLDATPDGFLFTSEFASRIGGRDRFVHKVHIRRLLHRSGWDTDHATVK